MSSPQIMAFVAMSFAVVARYIDYRGDDAEDFRFVVTLTLLVLATCVLLLTLDPLCIVPLVITYVYIKEEC